MAVRLLLADDDFRLRLLLQEALRLHGHHVQEATTGGQALRMLKEHRLDLAILDVIMPGLDGLEVCRATRSDPRLASLKIIIMSADASEAEALAAGADRFLAKPFRPSVLLRMVADLVGVTR